MSIVPRAQVLTATIALLATAPVAAQVPAPTCGPQGAEVDPLLLHDLLDEARAFVGRQQYPEAIDRFQRYLTLAPDDAGATLELARVLSWVQRYDEAFARYDALLCRQPDDVELRLERARVLIWAARYEEAVPALEALRREAPARVTAVTLAAPSEPGSSLSAAPAAQGPAGLLDRIDRVLADAYAWSGHTDQALPLYERLWSSSTSEHALGLAYARALARARRYDRAIAIYDQLLGLGETTPEVRFERGRVLLWAERYPEGLEALSALRDALTRQIEGTDGTAEPASSTAATAGSTAATAASIDSTAAAAAATDSGATTAAATSGAAAAPATADGGATKSGDGAADPANHPGTVDPELLDELERTLAAGYAWSRDYARAIDAYSALVAKHPADPDLRLELARALRDQKRLDPALEAYDRYLEVRSGDLVVGLERARLLLWAERYPDAIRAFLRLRERLASPARSGEITEVERGRYLQEVDRHLTRAYLWSGRSGDALPHLLALSDQVPEDASLAFDLARALALAGRLEEARAAYARYQLLGGTEANAAFGEGQTYQWEGDVLRARQAFLRALARSPGSSEAVAALKALEPELHPPGVLDLGFRTDAYGFAQETLDASAELPVGLLWIGPSIAVDRFVDGGASATDAGSSRIDVSYERSGWTAAANAGSSRTAAVSTHPGQDTARTGTSEEGADGAGERWRVTPMVRIRYRHSARLRLRGEAGLHSTAIENSPVSPHLMLATRWSATRTFNLELDATLADAVDTLFTGPALEARIRQLDGAATLSWKPVASWSVWSQARAYHLFEPEGLENQVFQGAVAVGRDIDPGGPGGAQIQLGVVAGALHAAHDSGSPPRYWAPDLYASGALKAGMTGSVPGRVRWMVQARAGAGYSSDATRVFPEVSAEATFDHRVTDRVGWGLVGGYGRTVRLSIVSESETAVIPYWNGRVTLSGWYRF